MVWMKTWSIRKPCFHALLAQRSMRANRKPSVKVVNLSCRFSNFSVASIDQQPCESPEHKSPSFLQEEVKKTKFIVEENHLRCVQESCDKEYAALPRTSFIYLGCFLLTRLGVTCSAWSFLGKAGDERTEHTSTKRKHRPVRDQYYWRFSAKPSVWSAWQAGLK